MLNFSQLSPLSPSPRYCPFPFPSPQCWRTKACVRYFGLLTFTPYQHYFSRDTLIIPRKSDRRHKGRACGKRKLFSFCDSILIIKPQNYHHAMHDTNDSTNCEYDGKQVKWVIILSAAQKIFQYKISRNQKRKNVVS